MDNYWIKNSLSERKMMIERATEARPGMEKLALEDYELYDAIVEHRRTYYALKYVDYDKHKRSVISFVPPMEVIDDWRKDYSDMQQFFIYGKALDFDDLIQRIQELQDRIRKQNL